MHSQKVKDFIKNKSYLFWWIKENKKQNISLSALVETILNYGNENDVKTLFELLGIKRVARIFFKQILNKRNNYHERTINFFNLYFKRHA